ncbi:MAG: phosphotransferase, partial [Planctomycetota bacterium]
MTGEVWSGEQPWKAMVDVGPERAEGHVRRAWPDLADAPLEPLGIGWDNTVYRLGTERVVRFPHRPIAAGLIEVEWPLLRAIAPRLPLPIRSGRGI